MYTDYLISSVVNILKEQSKFEASLIYVSDHGESLGEDGLYLHGTPMAIAPEVQYEIPLIVWNSQNEYPDFDDSSQYSHQNIFHSVMGALGAKGGAYIEAFDIFK